VDRWTFVERRRENELAKEIALLYANTSTKNAKFEGCQIVNKGSFLLVQLPWLDAAGEETPNRMN
jgi:hypothetical protein